MTVAVKDLFDVEGRRVGAGNPDWLAESAPAAHTAPAPAALLAAGATIAGIARTDEFAYSLAGTNGHYGTPPNPAAPDRIPGGSSSGPVSAVALGQATVGLGTDTAGSIRVPASYQGLYGIRPTQGAVPTDGLVPLAPSFDTVGWLARDPETLLAVGRVLLPSRDRRPFTRAIVSDDLFSVASVQVRSATGVAIADWRGESDLPPLEERSFDAACLPAAVRDFQTVQGWEAWQANGPWISRHWDSLNPDVRSRFEKAAGYTVTDRDRASVRLAEFAAELDRILGDDLMLLPSASSVAPTRAEASLGGPVVERARAATFALTCIAGATGRCAVSVPVPTSDGIPVGLCLVGPRGRDLDVLELVARLGGHEAR
ncbi:glutamyl-tRNA amidotransferase [Rhodococcus spelaei]|uniref:Glutamyl-tRNA amidotransferase n=2 Tax=Rhodococcus spelaei TaxID=2546320 RepID=A0A541BSF5_9NOCA|nr:glutamyl-tRNA amidotransferase [Rhodococcus spelaei]